MKIKPWVSGLASGLVLGLYIGVTVIGYFHLPQRSTNEVSMRQRPSHDASFVAAPSSPVSLERAARAHTSTQNATKSEQKIIVWTTDYFTGGPEALFQLVLALHRRGHLVYRTSDLAPQLRSYYPDWQDVPFVPFPDIDSIICPGDVIIIPERQSCSNLDRFPFGVRKIQWILAGDSHDPEPPCTFLHHSWELARANGSPMSTVLMPYIHYNRSGFAHDNLIESKRNTVCVAPHNVPHLADELQNSAFLKHHVPDIEVKLIKGLIPEEVVTLLKQCKILVDGNLPGLERLPLEAASFGATLLFNPSTGIPENVLDSPIPIDYLGPWSDERDSDSNSTRLERVVAQALEDYTAEARKFEPLRRRIAGMEAQFIKAVDRIIREAAAYVIPCNTTTDGEHCLLAAVSVLLVNPLSLVHILVGAGMRDHYVQEHAQLLSEIRSMHMEGLVVVNDAHHISVDNVFKSAPNHRTFILTPNAVVIGLTQDEGCISRQRYYTRPSSSVSHPLPRVTGTWSWEELRKLSHQHGLAEIDASGYLQMSNYKPAVYGVVFLHLFMEANVTLDLACIEPLKHLCCESLWRRAIANSLTWGRFCKVLYV